MTNDDIIKFFFNFSINSRIKVTPYNLQLDSKNAMDIASQYDVVLDCTDNVPTRYMLSDLSCFIKVCIVMLA